MMFHNFAYGMGGWGFVAMFLFWGGLILLVAWVIRGLTGTAPRPGGSNAREIADERYARGEISREEYQKIKKDLAG